MITKRAALMIVVSCFVCGIGFGIAWVEDKRPVLPEPEFQDILTHEGDPSWHPEMLKPKLAKEGEQPFFPLIVSSTRLS